MTMGSRWDRDGDKKLRDEDFDGSRRCCDTSVHVRNQ